MTSLTRETVYQALFGLVTPLLAPGASPASPGQAASPGNPTALRPFNLVSRETIEVQRVPPLLQPVLFLDEAVEEYRDRGRGLTAFKWTVYFHVGVTSSPGTPASTLLNPLLDLLQATLAPPRNTEQQLGLGDLIERAQFSGVSVKNLGNNSTDPTYRQAVAYVPFEITFA